MVVVSAAKSPRIIRCRVRIRRGVRPSIRRQVLVVFVFGAVLRVLVVVVVVAGLVIVEVTAVEVMLVLVLVVRLGVVGVRVYYLALGVVCFFVLICVIQLAN